MKRIPVRFAPIVFGALLSAMMVALVSAIVIALMPVVGDRARGPRARPRGAWC
jgi:hypothetical protein